MHTQPGGALPDPSLAAQGGWGPIPLPGGGNVQVTERDAGGAGGRAADRQNVLLRYDAPALGAVDLRFQMDAGALSLDGERWPPGSRSSSRRPAPRACARRSSGRPPAAPCR